MSQTATWGKPQSPDALRSVVALVTAVAIAVAVVSFGVMLRTDIAKPSAAACISLISGIPLLVVGRFLYRSRRRRWIRELRDARRGGISIGIARPRRERMLSMSPMVSTAPHRESTVVAAPGDPTITPDDDEDAVIILEV